MIEFKGIQKTTLVDYPGEVACTLFTGGCNFNCAYCYNPDLVLNRDTGVSISEREALEFLEERKGFLDGICVTGGEPLSQPGILGFLQKVKALGFKVKVDTNGSYPEVLREMMGAGVVDYLAMDIKAPLEKYEAITRAPVERIKIEESVKLIRSSGIEYEFRTTVSADLSLSDFETIGKWLAGSRKYCLQPVKVNLPLLDASFSRRNFSPTAENLQEIAARTRSFFEKVEIRA